MTTTLLHHEFLRTKGMLAVIAGVAVMLVLIGGLLGITGVAVLQALGMILAVLTAVALVPVVLLALAVDYWRSGYGRTGYLTHSIPARGSHIYGVRLLYGALVVVPAVALAGLLGLVPVTVAAAQEVPDGMSVTEMLSEVGREIWALTTPGMWLLLAAAIVVSCWGYLVQYYFAASIGSGRRLGALGPAGPIVVWVLLYLVQQVLFFVSIVALPLGLQVVDGAVRLTSADYLAAMRGGPDPQAMPFGFIPMVVVVTALLVWWTARAWNRQVALR